jgi:opacity protein-like surface antigen
VCVGQRLVATTLQHDRPDLAAARLGEPECGIWPGYDADGQGRAGRDGKFVKELPLRRESPDLILVPFREPKRAVRPDGVTNGPIFGSGSTSLAAWGWTVGGGIEYALTNTWSALLEYDYIDIGSVAVAFPGVAVINTQNIAVRQSIDIVKVGVNYRFDARSFGGPY